MYIINKRSQCELRWKSAKASGEVWGSILSLALFNFHADAISETIILVMWNGNEMKIEWMHF